MATLTHKPDWAERKVRAVWKRNGGLLSGDDLVRLLRAERRRAKHACRKIKAANDHNPDGYDDPYNQACDDCAKAIGG